MKYWRGEYVVFFPEKRVKFHTCVVCRRSLDLRSESSKTGIGPECARKPQEIVASAKARALASDRRRYREEVLDVGFKIERPA